MARQRFGKRLAALVGRWRWAILLGIGILGVVVTGVLEVTDRIDAQTSATVGLSIVIILLLVEIVSMLEEQRHLIESDFVVKFSQASAIEAMQQELPPARHNIEAIWSPFSYAEDSVRQYFESQLRLLDQNPELRIVRYVDMSQVAVEEVVAHISGTAFRHLQSGGYSLHLCKGPLPGAVRIDLDGGGIFLSPKSRQGTLFIHSKSQEFRSLLTGYFGDADTFGKEIPRSKFNSVEAASQYVLAAYAKRKQSPKQPGSDAPADLLDTMNDFEEVQDV
jgi:hypothetical protein